MNSLRGIVVWFGVAGTALILSDDLLALYKVIEFRGAVHDVFEYILIIFLFVSVGLSAVLLLISLLSVVRNSTRKELIVRRLCMVAAAFSVAVLLLNGVHLADWTTHALEGRNFSATWCLLVSVLCLMRTRRTPKIDTPMSGKSD
ncbi:MAG: hypothetical protein JOY84_18965 [Curvibacter sp.]|nr:hypothetical protein [Curvibacter sp.]